MAKHELADLAWSINSLLTDDRVRNHFRGRCRQYLTMRAETPCTLPRHHGNRSGNDLRDGPSESVSRPPPLPFGTDGDFDLKPPLKPCERYAILAALHEVVCKQESPVNHSPEDSERDPFRRIMDENTWTALLHHAENLDNRSRSNVEACVEFVRRDLATLESLPELQRAILSSLDGRAMSLKVLAQKLEYDPSQLHRTHLKPLMDAGRVANDRKRGGYYRPDAPPIMA
jgi:hypothetical protein